MQLPVSGRTLGLMLLVMLGVGILTIGVDYFDTPPGDYEVRKGDIHLSSGEWDQAIEDFDAALVAQPDHRGALMGRAIAYLQMERYDEAEAEFQYLIDFLEETLVEDDTTGRGALAAAYANLGILYDRTGRHQLALESYVSSVQVDRESVEGPGIMHRIIHNPEPSSVENRIRHLVSQFELPEEERVFTMPEIDEQQRMHKP